MAVGHSLSFHTFGYIPIDESENKGCAKGNKDKGLFQQLLMSIMNGFVALGKTGLFVGMRVAAMVQPRMPEAVSVD